MQDYYSCSLQCSMFLVSRREGPFPDNKLTCCCPKIKKMKMYFFSQTIKPSFRSMRQPINPLSSLLQEPIQILDLVFIAFLLMIISLRYFLNQNKSVQDIYSYLTSILAVTGELLSTWNITSWW